MGREIVIFENLENRLFFVVADPPAFLFSVYPVAHTEGVSKVWGRNQPQETDPLNRQSYTPIYTDSVSVDLQGTHVSSRRGGTAVYSGDAALDVNAEASGTTASVSVGLNLGLSVTESPAFSVFDFRFAQLRASVRVEVWAYDDLTLSTDGVEVTASSQIDQADSFVFRYNLGNTSGGSFAIGSLGGFRYGGNYLEAPAAPASTSFLLSNPGIRAPWTDPQGNTYKHVGEIEVWGDVNDMINGDSDYDYTARMSGTFHLDVKRTGLSQQPPVAQIAGPIEVVLGSTETLVSTSYDPDDGTAANQGIVSWAWRDITDPATPIDLGAEPIAMLSGVPIGDRKIELAVTDNEGQTHSTIHSLIVDPKPDVEVKYVKTIDPKTIEVSYEVTGNRKGEAFSLNVYRSADALPQSEQDALVFTTTISGSDAKAGLHTITVGDNGEYSFSEQLALRPDPSHSFVIATADETGELSEENKDSVPNANFRKYLIGAVTHGYTFSLPNELFGTGVPYQTWVDTYAQLLGIAGGYDDYLGFHWETASVAPQMNVTTVEGERLATHIIGLVNIWRDGDRPNDVFDVHLIGHSRGGVLIGQAMQYIEEYATDPALANGFHMLTMLDPHPARNGWNWHSRFELWRALSLYGENPLQLLYAASEFAVSRTEEFQEKANDPDPIVPSNVQKAVEYFQRTPADLFPFGSASYLMNLLGFPMQPTSVLQVHELNGMSHSGVNDWYGDAVLKIGWSLRALGLTPFSSNTGLSVSSNVAAALAVGSGGYQAVEARSLAAFGNSAEKLEFIAPPPETVTAGTPFSVKVKAVSADGLIDTSYDGVVQLMLIDGHRGAVRAEANFVGGVAEFNDLILYSSTNIAFGSLVSEGLPELTTSTFAVTPGSPARLEVLSPLATVTREMPVDVIVAAVDEYGNIVDSYSGPVSAAVDPDFGTWDTGSKAEALFDRGAVIFRGLRIHADQQQAELEITAEGLQTSLVVQLVGHTLVLRSIDGEAETSIEIAVFDESGEVDAGYDGEIQAELYRISNEGIERAGVIKVQAIKGVAVFKDLHAAEAGKYVLVFTAADATATGTDVLELNDAVESVTGTIAGYTFNDSDHDGVLDASEVKAGGKQVFLDLNNNGKLDANEPSMFTDSTGAFRFDGLAAGTYHVRRVFPKGYTYSTPLIDVDLTAGEAISNLAIGSKTTMSTQPKTGTLAGYTFNDSDRDGALDASEVKAGGKQVFLDLNNNGKLDANEPSVFTDSTGAFRFGGLDTGTYHVRRVFPKGYTYSTPLIDITLAAGQTVNGLAIGSKSTASALAGFAFNDSDRDGVFDANEVKTGGKRVFLDLNSNGKLDAKEPSVFTDVKGAFRFDNLTTGIYHVRRVFPKGYTYSTPLIDVTLNAGQTVSDLAIGSKPV